jgi:cellobiose phosphorylase
VIILVINFSLGVLSSALGLHAYPSDLDLFLLLAVFEHVTVTGDTTWLTNPNIPFYGSTSPSSVLDHLRVAFKHLVDEVGVGNHGFVRCGDGDWDDGLVVEYDPSPLAIAYSTEFGESVPNTLMAIYVLPRIARVIEGVDAQLSGEMMDYANQVCL